MWIMIAITNIYLALSRLQSTLYCINLLNDKSITFQDFMMRSCYEACLKSTWIKHVTVIISIKSCSTQKKKMNHKGPEVTSTAFNFWQISHLCSVCQTCSGHIGLLFCRSPVIFNSSCEYLMKFIMHLQQIAHLSQPQREMWRQKNRSWWWIVSLLTSAGGSNWQGRCLPETQPAALRCSRAAALHMHPFVHPPPVSVSLSCHLTPLLSPAHVSLSLFLFIASGQSGKLNQVKLQILLMCRSGG